MPRADTADGGRRSIDSPSTATISRRAVLASLGLGALGAVPLSSGARSPPSTTGTSGRPDVRRLRGHGAPDPSRPRIARDAAVAGLAGDGPTPGVATSLALAGRGQRLLPRGTTDVWALDGYAYLGTFGTPCGTGEGFGDGGLVDDLLGPGVAVFDVGDPDHPAYVGSLPSVEGSRINDVKVATTNAGTILVHSNEPCDGGPGGFEVYDVEDPTAPVHLASVRVDDANQLLREEFGFTDFGVHNLFVFTQKQRDYVAAVVESEFGNFQIFEITDPADPQFVSAWGAELLACGDCRDVLYAEPFDPDDFGLILALDDHMVGGFGTSRNRFLHDVTVSADGTRAYLASWDAGLVLLDVSDPADPRLVSVALGSGAGDGEVNSHQAWPSADGSVVVETGEDFDPFALAFEIGDGPDAGDHPATEGAFTRPVHVLPDRTMGGPTTYVGLACDPDAVPPASGPGEIAVARRGVCPFADKVQHAIDAGYEGIVVFNDAARGDEVITMGGASRDLPGVFVGHSTGLAIFGVPSVGGLTVGTTGASVDAVAVPERWGNVRIWDYTDETTPVLASEFDTRCSSDPAHETCDPRGTYSVHNAIVEGNRVYLSWYSDGVLVLDITDPHSPVEVARYAPAGDDFEAENGGILDVWGVHKNPREPWIYASDRNGGLYVIEEVESEFVHLRR